MQAVVKVVLDTPAGLRDRYPMETPAELARRL